VIEVHEKLKRLGLESDLHSKFDVPDDIILAPNDVAKLVNTTASTVRRWCANGKLPSYNFGGKYCITGSDFKIFMKRSKKLTNTQRKVVGAI
jgi:excisionase family DNA binding protein